jgi:carbonic anhydrase
MPGDETFGDVLAANAAYAAAFSLSGLSGKAERGLAILTCMDTRIEPLQMLGLRPGDAKILRNAGARVDDAVLATLVLSRHLLGVERVMVIAHTNCRMAGGTADTVRAAIAEAGGPDTSAFDYPVTSDQRASLCADVEGLRGSGYLDGLAIGGFLYDVESGRLERVV